MIQCVVSAIAPPTSTLRPPYIIHMMNEPISHQSQVPLLCIVLNANQKIKNKKKNGGGLGTRLITHVSHLVLQSVPNMHQMHKWHPPTLQRTWCLIIRVTTNQSSYIGHHVVQPFLIYYQRAYNRLSLRKQIPGVTSCLGG